MFYASDQIWIRRIILINDGCTLYTVLIDYHVDPVAGKRRRLMGNESYWYSLFAL